MSRLLMAVVAGLALAAAPERAAHAQAGNWPDTLFSERSHDFGAVPRGGIVRHPFVLTNRLNVPVSILNLRVSCGCTSGTAGATLIQPGQATVVEAQMDTRNFVGRKSTTLFVSVMAGNAQAEIALGVSSLILSDVVLNPGSIDFGTVARGQSPTLTMAIDRIGKPDWKVVKLVSGSKVLNASLRETQRAGGTVGYQLSVSIKPEASAGTIRDEIRLITNDPETPGIPVLVSALIRGDLSATPSLLAMGNAAKAGSVQGRYIVRASKPFAIGRVEGDGDGFKLAAADSSKKTMHVLTLTYTPAQGQTRGDLVKKFKIATDLPGEAPVEVSATVHVEP